MESGLAPIERVDDDDLHMGSEYANARAFLAHHPRVTVGQIRKKKKEPQHGSNDSDFGFTDQKPD
jgi:hypothetical protein